MRQADDQGVAVGDGLLLARLGVVGEGQQRRGKQQHGAHDYQDVGGVEHGVDPVFEEEADDPDGDHRKYELQHVGLLGVEAARKEPLQEAPHLAPQHDDGAEYRSGVQCHVEEQVLFDLYPHERLGDLQVPAARHGQEFRNTLHDTEQDGL